MQRVPVDGDGSTPASEPPRRKTGEHARPSTWKAKVFSLPPAVAEVLSKVNESVFGHHEPAQAKPPAEPAERRHRGFYVWRPTVNPEGKPYALGHVVRLIEEIDPRTGEIKAPRRKDIS
jgi:hypothetical protein